MKHIDLRSSAFICGFKHFVTYRLRRSRRALRFLLPTLRRRRGLAMGNAPFNQIVIGRPCVVP
jgi:hypothetical protein